MFYERDTTVQILSLARVTTLGRLRAGLSYLLEAHGFRYYVFTCHTVESDGACTAVLHNLPSRKQAAPASVDNVIVNDPLAQYAINETLPMDWRSLMSRPEYQGRIFRAAMNRRVRRGMRSGCTVPLLQGYGALAWLDLALDRDDESAWAHIRQYLPYATLLGRVVLDKTRRLGKKPLSADDVSSEPLDERERACCVALAKVLAMPKSGHCWASANAPSPTISTAPAKNSTPATASTPSPRRCFPASFTPARYRWLTKWPRFIEHSPHKIKKGAGWAPSALACVDLAIS
ncbi:MAG: autoinducer binding domain-containing protein [Alcanivorax sp.]|nr:autoinducer binding domain-containing protein [Alcanivorax sp.]